MPLPLAPLALAAAAYFVFSGDDKDGPQKPVETPELTPAALDAMTVIRTINGKQVRLFRAEVLGVTWPMLWESRLQPVPVPPGLAGAAIYRVVSDPSARTDPANAMSAAKVATDQGLAVIGTHAVPLPQYGDRFLVFAQPAQALQIAAPSGDYALLTFPDSAVTTTTPGGGTAPKPPSPYGTPVDETPPGGFGPPGGVPVTPGGTDPYDAHMTSTMRAELDQTLGDPNADPWKLEDLADELAPSYPVASATVRRRSQQIRAERTIRDTARGYSEHVIRYGDLAGRLAQAYTGDGSRFRELYPVNAHRSMRGDAQGNPTPWSGTIRIPVSWHYWDKRPPEPAHGAPPGPAPTVEEPPERYGEGVDPGEGEIEYVDVDLPEDEIAVTPFGGEPDDPESLYA